MLAFVIPAQGNLNQKSINRIRSIPGSEAMTGEAYRIDSALYPVSSWSSRIAACSAVSPSSMSPNCLLEMV